MKAVCLIREQPNYRRDAFVAGLQRAGYTLVDSLAAGPTSAKDLLIIWNRYGMFEQRANQWEGQGGTVLVAENGYVGKDAEGLQYYALAMHGHNGSGWFPIGDEDRFAQLNVTLKPFVDRPTGYYLICGQRGIGSRSMASPPNWHEHAKNFLQGHRKSVPVKTRLHPGNNAPTTPLEDDFSNAAVCVIWSSSSGVKALIEGIPVKYDAPHWICEGAATKLRSVEVKRDDAARLQALQRMAWAQWSVAELATGEPFKRIAEGRGSATW